MRGGLILGGGDESCQVTVDLVDMAETTMPLLSAKREPVVGKVPGLRLKKVDFIVNGIYEL